MSSAAKRNRIASGVNRLKRAAIAAIKSQCTHTTANSAEYANSPIWGWGWVMAP